MRDTMTDDLVITEVDFDRKEHRDTLVTLVNEYAKEPMGAGRPLEDEVRSRLGEALRAHPTTVALLAHEGDRPVGYTICFLGFSTFAGRQLLNVHDLSVLPSHRGRGVGRALLAAAEEKARELGCCKLTLEVFELNPAKRLYESFGFEGSTNGDGDAGRSLFYVKDLRSNTSI